MPPQIKTPQFLPQLLCAKSRENKIILYMRPANDRQCYIVTSSVIGWAHTLNDPCQSYMSLQPVVCCNVLRWTYFLSLNVLTRWPLRDVTVILWVWNSSLRICFEIAVVWMAQNITKDKSVLVQVMAWCCQATSHYQSQCWSRSMSPYGFIRPQWVNVFTIKWPEQLVIQFNDPYCSAHPSQCAELSWITWHLVSDGTKHRLLHSHSLVSVRLVSVCTKHRLLHSHSLVVVELSMGYETWHLIGWYKPFEIGCFVKSKLGP